jgi:4-carboxymuconolactone decarboxylase
MTGDDDRYERGVRLRREVLGDEHVDRSLNGTTEFTAPAQELVTAINNGCTVEEIRETLLQATVYCGAPAGLQSFREAQSVLDELAAPAGA